MQVTKACGCGASFSGSPESSEKAYADHQELVHGIEPDALQKRIKQLEEIVRNKNSQIADLEKKLSEKV